MKPPTPSTPPSTRAAVPNFYYKSWHACSSTEGAGISKCPADAPSLQCGGDSDVLGLWCAEADMLSCDDILAGLKAESPDGAGFMWPGLMLGSSEMRVAAASDGYEGAYAVVTFDELPLGTCIEISNADAAAFPRAPILKAQVFNTAADAVDVYMAGGGLGAFNGCSAAGGQTREPRAPFYRKYPTSANLAFLSYLKDLGYADDALAQMDSVITWSGGIRGGATYAACVKAGGSRGACAPVGNGCGGGGGLCVEDAETACTLAFEGQSEYTTTKAVESCTFAFEHDLHWNRPVTVEVVACPHGLTALTGLVPTEASNRNVVSRTFATHVTTMEDCSLPSASRFGNTASEGAWEEGHDAMYASNLLGARYTADDMPRPTVATPCAR